MRTKQSNRNFVQRKTKKYGDGSIVWGSYSSEFWKEMMFDPKKAFWSLFVDFLKFQKAMLAFGVNVIFRFKFGSATTGFLMTFMTLSFICVFNSIHIWKIFSPFLLFAVPILPLLLESEELHQFFIIDVHSKALLIYAGVFCVFACVHVFMIYFKRGNKSATKRGESWLYKGLSKFMLVNEYFICGVVEPLITATIGYAFWNYYGDIYFAIFLWISAASVAFQQLIDISYQAQNQSLLDM